MKNLVRAYITVGLCASIVSVVVLVKDGKDSPSEIARYAAINGFMWPGMIVVAANKSRNS